MTKIIKVATKNIKIRVNVLSLDLFNVTHSRENESKKSV